MGKQLEIPFEREDDNKNVNQIDELYKALSEMEEEYQWTQDVELKLRMQDTAQKINDLLLNERYNDWRTNTNS